MNHLRLLVATLALPLLTLPAPAQAPGANWKTTLTTGNPPQRRENPGAADATHMYVFGGMSGGSGGSPMNDLWSFDGVAWTLKTADGAAGSPPARSKAGVAWNFAKGRLMVFGGADASGTFLDDTWEWDPGTNTWAEVSPSISPSPRQYTALTQDYATGKMLLFGGQGTAGDLDDTWLYSAGNWQPVNLGAGSTQPTPRRQHVLEGRPDMADSVLAVGQDATGKLSDTWTWDGLTWRKVPTTVLPVGKTAVDSAYDWLRRRLVIVGGEPGPTGQISEFDSELNDWVIRPLDPGIFKVTRYFLAYVPGLGKTYKVSGQSLNGTKPPDWTYEYQTDTLASISTSGVGCAGLGGVPVAAPGPLPWLGSSTSVTLTNVAPTELALMLVGFDAASWLGLPLPLDLGAILGAPGCNLYLAPDNAYMKVLGTGPTPPPFSVALPSDLAFAGLTFYAQGLVWDLATGFATSNLVTAVLGAK